MKKILSSASGKIHHFKGNYCNIQCSAFLCVIRFIFPFIFTIAFLSSIHFHSRLEWYIRFRFDGAFRFWYIDDEYFMLALTRSPSSDFPGFPPHSLAYRTGVPVCRRQSTAALQACSGIDGRPLCRFDLRP